LLRTEFTAAATAAHSSPVTTRSTFELFIGSLLRNAAAAGCRDVSTIAVNTRETIERSG
jgi:hypothetical protein